ncbi:MAG: TonB-dependent receptor [Alphaproteobacteria bacterium]
MRKITLILLGLAVATTATAQQSDTDDTAKTASGAENPAQTRKLDEIVVTAQKREQDIREVPTSVSTLSGDDLKEMNVENMDDLSRVTPNLNIASDGVFNTISIRGLGSGTNKGFEQSVGIFIDDIYYASTQRLLAAMFDIERVEVLRGPQGTLFGRNTIAGAVSMHTGTVAYDWGLALDSTFGERDWNKHTVIVNAPLIDDVLAVRLGGQYFDREGHIYDRTLEDTNGDMTNESYRAKARLSLGDDAEIKLIAQHQKSSVKGGADQYHKVPDMWHPVLAAFDPEFEDGLDDYAHGTNEFSGGELTFWDFSAHTSFRAVGHDMIAILGYSTSESDGGLDVDFGPAPIMRALGGGYVDQINAELRILSDPGTIEYVAGLYYFWSDRNDWQDIQVAPVIGTGATQFILPQVAQAITDGIIPAVGPFEEETRSQEFHQKGSSYAAYGQATWHILDELSLIIGARISIDYKDLHFTAEHKSINGNQGPAILYGLIIQAEEFDITDERDDAAFTPKISAIYRVTDDINLYATVAQGFKAGGFNSAATNTEAELQFEPEYSLTYEAGLKGDFFGGAARLNLGLFRTEFDDLQVSSYNGIEYIVQNAATAISQGVEADGMALLPWGFLATMSFAWTDAYMDSFPFGPCQTQARTEDPQGAGDFCDVSGNQLPGAPEYQYSIGLTHLNHLGNLPIDFVIGADYYWKDHQFFAIDGDPEDAQDAYGVLNGRIGLRDDEGLWNFTVFVKNILDEVALTGSHDIPLISGGHVGSVIAPRTVTANFNISF